MKKIISVLLSGTFISFAIMSSTSGQSFDRGLSFAALKNTHSLASYVAENSSFDNGATTTTDESLKEAKKNFKASKANLKAMKANFKATENFKKLFKDAPDAKWSVEEQAIVASFTRDEVKTNVIYNKKGTWIHTLSYSPESKMPESIKTIVKNAYPDDNITQSIEVKEGDMTFYIVQLEGCTKYKQVAVYDGETGLIKEYTKSR